MSEEYSGGWSSAYTKINEINRRKREESEEYQLREEVKNKNINKELDSHYVDGVTFLVEANSFEAMCLWKEYKDKGFSSENNLVFITVGELIDMPVCMTIGVGTIGNVKFVMYEPTSVVVDHRMIKEFLDYHYDEVERVDAMNFGRVVNAANRGLK